MLLAAGFLGCVAARAERQWAPWLIFPALAGTTLGGMAVHWRKVRPGGRRTAELIGTVVAAGLLTVVQHAVGHRLAIADAAARLRAPSIAGGRVPQHAWPEWARRRLPPARLGAFLEQQAARGRVIGGFVARDHWAWCSWALDALLVAAAAAMVVGSAHARSAGETLDGSAISERRGESPPS